MDNKSTPTLSFSLTGRVWQLPDGKHMLTISLINPDGRIETLYEGPVPPHLLEPVAMRNMLRDLLKLDQPLETKPWYYHG